MLSVKVVSLSTTNAPFSIPVPFIITLEVVSKFDEDKYISILSSDSLFKIVSEIVFSPVVLPFIIVFSLPSSNVTFPPVPISISSIIGFPEESTFTFPVALPSFLSEVSDSNFTYIPLFISVVGVIVFKFIS